jgi:hypothetical protein
MSAVPNNFGSLTFHSRITSYDLLAQRVQRQLGAPLIQIEAAAEMLYENIDIACEYYTKFAGTTEEYIVFRSDLYTPGVGLYIGNLFNVSPEMYKSNTFSPTGVSSLNGLVTGLSAGFDYDLNSYRHVVDVFSFEEGQNKGGVNVLFSIEHAVAQQAYFGALMGNMGFDLVNWNAMSGWLKLRRKLFASDPYLRFDPTTQILKIIPEPSQASDPYFGLMGVRLQLPIKSIVSQIWVQQYTLALTKMSVSHVRGKFGGTSLFGGQSVSYQDLMSQGLEERNRLENDLKHDKAEIGQEHGTAFWIG